MKTDDPKPATVKRLALAAARKKIRERAEIEAVERLWNEAVKVLAPPKE